MFAIFILILTILFVFLLMCFFLFSIVSEFAGAPYVGTQRKIIDQILADADLKKGQRFIELGCGDGRMILRAAQKYHVQGLGVDIHSLLILYCRLRAKLGSLNVRFVNQNFYKTNLRSADVVFLFLMPKTLSKLSSKILKECQPGTLVISHGFRFKDLDNYHLKTTSRKVFPTYFYKIK